MQVNSGSYLITGSLKLPFMTAWVFNETASWQQLSQSVVSQGGVNQLLINGNTELSSTYNINATDIILDNSIACGLVHQGQFKQQHILVFLVTTKDNAL
jgi:hypothetical protein